MPPGTPPGTTPGTTLADSATSWNTLLGGRVKILQPAKGYRTAIDPVLLAAAVPAEPEDSVLDAGAGTGAAALSLAARVEGVRVTGLEVQPDLAALARESARASGLAEQVTFAEGDLLTPPEGFRLGGFDHVMANPPYLAAGSGNPPPDPAKRRATVEGAAALGDWLRFLVSMVRDGGTVTVIHRYERADEVTGGLSEEAGGIVVFPLWAKEQEARSGISRDRDKNKRGAAAKRVIVRARKGEKGETRTAAGLVLHQKGGAYTPEAEAVLRDGGALAL